MSGGLRRLPGFSLYHEESCPHCLRVRRALEQLGIALELRDVRRQPRFRRELLRATGRATVPCLRIDGSGGAVLWMHESREIVEYLEERFAGLDGG